MFEKKEKITLSISGMHCGHCMKRVSDTLNGLKGVKKATVSLENGTADVEYIPSKITVNEMISAIKAIGFDASEG